MYLYNNIITIEKWNTIFVQSSLILDDKPLADKYQIRNKLKSGGFGSVYLAKGVGKDTNEYAVKLIPKKFKKYAEI